MPESNKRTKRTRRRTKDRVLQARIPEDLDDELRDRAEQLGLTVSNVVRNVLMNTFDLVEDVVSDSAQLARAIKRKEKPSSLPPPSQSAPSDEGLVIGWQQAVLNRNGVCEQCNNFLKKGEVAAVGVPVQSRPLLLCPPCLSNIAQSDDKPPEFTPAE